MKNRQTLSHLRQAMRQRRNNADFSRVLRDASPAMRNELLAAAAEDSRFVFGPHF